MVDIFSYEDGHGRAIPDREFLVGICPYSQQSLEHLDTIDIVKTPWKASGRLQIKGSAVVGGSSPLPYPPPLAVSYGFYLLTIRDG